MNKYVSSERHAVGVRDRHVGVMIAIVPVVQPAHASVLHHAPVTPARHGVPDVS